MAAQLSSNYPVSKVSKYLKVSRMTLYREIKGIRKSRIDDSNYKDLVIRVFHESDDSFGAKSIKDYIWDEYGICLSKRRIRRIMHENFLISAYTESYYSYKTKRHDTVNNDTHKNELERRFNNKNHLEVIVSDLTYVRVGKSWNYICVLEDLFNREIISYAVGPNKDSELVLRAFMKLNIDFKKVNYFHTDRGAEFKNLKIDELLSRYGIKRSLSNPGNPVDNSCAESLYKTIKTTFIRKYHFENLEQLNYMFLKWVWWYNHDRPHSSLGGISPIKFKNRNLGLLD